MSENPRDTQFQGFAELVTQEIMRSDAADKVDVDRFWDEENIAEVEQIVARWGFDLVNHAMQKLIPYDYETNLTQDLVYLIPDLETLPKENTNG